MLKGRKLLWSLLFATVLICAACDDESAKEKTLDVDYKIVSDEKLAKRNERAILVTTEVGNKQDYEAITEEVKVQYDGEGLDSIDLIISNPPADKSDKFPSYFINAQSFIAYTDKGAAQTGVEKGISYKIEINKEKPSELSYKIVADEKSTRTGQRHILVLTEATDKKDFEVITEEVMDLYDDKGLNSIDLYIFYPVDEFIRNNKPGGKLSAQSFIAYTAKGAAQTGLDKAHTYKIKLEE